MTLYASSSHPLFLVNWFLTSISPSQPFHNINLSSIQFAVESMSLAVVYCIRETAAQVLTYDLHKSKHFYHPQGWIMFTYTWAVVSMSMNMLSSDQIAVITGVTFISRRALQ